MDKNEIIEKLKLYASVLQNHFQLKKMILFGSYASGNAGPESDIDVALIVEKYPADYFSSTALIRKLRRSIDNRIEPMLFEDKNDPSGFLSEIEKKGDVIFSK
ncbi:MAG: nucleotidyltransferase domain-containing protein [Bacteroidota bacterium]